MGVLSAQSIEGLIEDGAVALGAPLGPKQLQPSSLDLTLGRRAWRVRASFLPAAGRRVEERIKDGLLMHELDLGVDGGAVLERGCVYLVELRERLKLPHDIVGAANPKSSTGRIDVFVRLVTDAGAAGARFDVAEPGYQGPLFVEISPRTFSIVAREGSSLNQIRFKRDGAAMSDADLRRLHDARALIDGAVNIENGIGLRAQIAGARGEFVGWRARRHTGLIDVDRVGALVASDYFVPIPAPPTGHIILDPDEFYILASRECLAIPPDCAAEMTPISPGLGEFRVHYAGFFDPGFGWETPARAVLEVRSHDAPFVLEDGQLVARLVFERMSERPKVLYGDGLASNYSGQGLRLSKHFRE